MKPNHNPYLVNLIVCWVYLAVSVIITLTGSDYFAFDESELQPLIKFCNLVEGNYFIEGLIRIFTNIVTNYFAVLAILNQKKYTRVQLPIFLGIFIGSSIASWFGIVPQLIFNILYFGVPMIFLKKKFYRSLIGAGFIALVQQGLLFIRNVGNWYIDETMALFASITLQLDMFMIVVLYYLYFTRKEV